MTGLREKGKQRRRSRILEAARLILADQGLPGLSTRKLSEAAELSVHTLYKLVGNKEDILVAVMRDNHEHVSSSIRQLKSQHPIDQIFALIQSTYEILQLDPTQTALMRILMQLNDENGVNEQIVEMLNRGQQVIESALTDACEQNILHCSLSTEALAETLNAIYIGNLRDYLFGRRSLNSFLHQTRFGFWLQLGGAAREKQRGKFLQNAEIENQKLSEKEI